MLRIRGTASVYSVVAVATGFEGEPSLGWADEPVDICHCR
jgi:hypothetical protein